MFRSSSRSVAGLCLIGMFVAAVGFFTASRAAEARTRPISHNDMREAAGRALDGVLAVELEAREGTWQPGGPRGPSFQVAAFAEAGGPPRTPGPLVRVPAGTEVRGTVANVLDVPLTVYGLGERRGLDADSVRLEPGAVHDFRFVADVPGVYQYAGRTTPVPGLLFRFDYDAQLNGVIVIDPGDAPSPPRDRLFLISAWSTFDSTTVSGLGPDPALAINGAIWPDTERFDIAVGDSLHWRIINATILPHPMHLHGFYFRLDAVGDGTTYRELPSEQRRLAVTEVVQPGGVIALSWSPDRPGNWLFHCHFAGHLTTYEAFERDRRHPETIARAGGGAATHPAHQTEHEMTGMALGIRVSPRGDELWEVEPTRSIRLLARSRPEVWGQHAGYGFALGGSEEESRPRAFTIPGPLLVLERGEPVAVTVVNQAHEPAAVHWHGVEVDSPADGVPDWSGYGPHVVPSVAPGDSLTVTVTPRRAGTFMYHSHFNAFQQVGSGMYGPIIVVEPGERLDPERDRVLLLSDAGPTLDVVTGPFPPVLLNGEERPGPIDLTAGVSHRLRLIAIGAEVSYAVSILDGNAPVEWRIVAKDGAELPPATSRLEPAKLVLAAGEIYDVEVTPRRPGALTLRLGHADFPGAQPSKDIPLRVR